MEGSRYEYEIQGDKIIFLDKEHKGGLTIKFSPANKKDGSLLMDSVLCDVMTDIHKKKLNLVLKGHSVIKVRHEFALIGDVELRSCHLTDTKIENSKLDFVSMIPYTDFKDSKIGFLGSTSHGKLIFEDCNIEPSTGFKLQQYQYAKFVNNEIQM